MLKVKGVCKIAKSDECASVNKNQTHKHTHTHTQSRAQTINKLKNCATLGTELDVRIDTENTLCTHVHFTMQGLA